MAAAVRVKGGKEAGACGCAGVAATAGSGRERSSASSAAPATDRLRQQPYVLSR